MEFESSQKDPDQVLDEIDEILESDCVESETPGGPEDDDMLAVSAPVLHAAAL
jgi:hypothetical protein